MCVHIWRGIIMEVVVYVGYLIRGGVNIYVRYGRS